MANELRENGEAPRVVRFLRCRTTKRYFGEQGWTEDLNSAKAFPGAMEAAQACVRYALANVELVLCAQNIPAPGKESRVECIQDRRDPHSRGDSKAS